MRILTQAQLAALLASVDAKAVAKAAKVSTKTIQRYMAGKTSPSLTTLELMLPLLRDAERKSKRAPAVPAAQEG